MISRHFSPLFLMIFLSKYNHFCCFQNMQNFPKGVITQTQLYYAQPFNFVGINYIPVRSNQHYFDYPLFQNILKPKEKFQMEPQFDNTKTKFPPTYQNPMQFKCSSQIQVKHENFAPQKVDKESQHTLKSIKYQKSKNLACVKEQFQKRPYPATKIRQSRYLPYKNKVDSEVRIKMIIFKEENNNSESQNPSKHSYQKSVVSQFTKQLIIFLLYNENQDQQVLQSIKIQIAEQFKRDFGRNTNSTIKILDELIKMLSSKLSKFKKTKEEMIKYIFRKIFNIKSKPKEISELKWRIARIMHEKNSLSFKSMNMKYVAKEFENPIFAQMYEIFLKNFQSNYQKQNQERVDRINMVVTTALIDENLSGLRIYRKMPWNLKIKDSIIILFDELNKINKNISYPLNALEDLIDEFKKGHPAEYNSLIERQSPCK